MTLAKGVHTHGEAKGLETGDPHLNLALLILRGVPLFRREEWMRRNMPRTYSYLCAGRLYENATYSDTGSRSRSLHEVASGSMQHPQRGAYL
jgi:hypothetical protein